MKTKIAVVCDGLRIGGAENMVCQLVTHIDREKYEIAVFCIGRERKTFLEDEIRQKRIPLKICGIEGRVTPAKLKRFYNLLREFQPDIIHTHISGAIYSLPYAVLRKKKIIHTLHTSPKAEFKPWFRKIMRHLYCRGMAMLVAVSEENQKLAMEMYRLDDDKVLFINNGVNIEKYYHTSHAEFTYINVGRQDENKNQQLILYAFRKLIDRGIRSKLILVGDGNQHEKLKQLVCELNLTGYVEMPGMVSDCETYLAASDIYVQSSRREGLPLSVVEAMAAKLPVVSTDVGGMKDLVQENGLLVESDSCDALAEAMYSMAMKRDCLEQYAMKSYLMAKEYSSAKMAEKYCMAYERVLKG